MYNSVDFSTRNFSKWWSKIPKNTNFLSFGKQKPLAGKINEEKQCCREHVLNAIT
jgi:hypothetical protein